MLSLPYGMPNQVSKGTARPGCTLLPECLVERAEHRGAREGGGRGKSWTVSGFVFSCSSADTSSER